MLERKLRNRGSLPASREGTPKETSNRRSNRNNKTNEVQRNNSTRSKQSASNDAKKSKARNNKKSEPANETTNELRGGRKRKRTANDPNDEDTQQPKRQKVESRSKRGRRSLKKIEELVNEFALHEDAWPFLKPVSKKAVPDYYEFITNPMDVKTIKAKMNRLEYNDSQQIIEDLRLMLKNCFQYNVTKAEVYKCGKIMEKWLNERLKETDLA